jgi:hypothetical protein
MGFAGYVWNAATAQSHHFNIFKTGTNTTKSSSATRMTIKWDIKQAIIKNKI